MAYKVEVIDKIQTVALGVGDVLCEFTITGQGHKCMRVQAVSTAQVSTIIKLQTSMDGINWVDVNTSAETSAKVHSILIGDVTDATVIPLAPLGRLVATATATFTEVRVAMDR